MIFTCGYIQVNELHAWHLVPKWGSPQLDGVTENLSCINSGEILPHNAQMYLEKLCGETSIFLTGFGVLCSTDTRYVWDRQPPASSHIYCPQFDGGGSKKVVEILALCCWVICLKCQSKVGNTSYLNFVTGAGRPITNQHNDSLPYRAPSVPQKKLEFQKLEFLQNYHLYNLEKNWEMFKYWG